MGNGSIIHQMLEMKKRPEPLLVFIFACPEVPLSRILQVEVFEDVSKDLLEGGLLLFFLKILGLLDRLFHHTAFGFPHIGGRGSRGCRVFKEVLEALHD